MNRRKQPAISWYGLQTDPETFDPVVGIRATVGYGLDKEIEVAGVVYWDSRSPGSGVNWRMKVLGDIPRGQFADPKQAIVALQKEIEAVILGKYNARIALDDALEALLRGGVQSMPWIKPDEKYSPSVQKKDGFTEHPTLSPRLWHEDRRVKADFRPKFF